MMVQELDDLKWSARHQIGDITISMVQGKGVHGSRQKNNFEVLIWDNDGDIPLSESDIGYYMSWQELTTLMNTIQRWKHPTQSWAEFQRAYWASKKDFINA